MDPTHRFAQVNGIRYHYVEAGGGPSVLLLHGFPELWYSFRHQLPELARAGYRAIAPDLRGFGETEVTPAVEDYSLLRHAADVKALLDGLGISEVVLVGHDWGANLAWTMMLLYPSLTKAIVGLSIPFYPKPRDPADIRRFSGSSFNFVTYFQKPGAVEAEVAADPRQFFRTFLYGLSGDAPAGTMETLYRGKPADAKLLDGFPRPRDLPPWLTEGDVEYYASAFERTGMSPALGFYRNIDNDYRALKRLHETALRAGTLPQPVLFIGGAEEAAVRFGDLAPMRTTFPNLRGTIVLPGCGHWVQQERPQDVNAAISTFLREIAPGAG
jgi:pimeloyl-ACP methyl ester carboxylesterase